MSELDGIIAQMQRRTKRFYILCGVVLAVLVAITTWWIVTDVLDDPVDYNPETYSTIYELADAASAAGLPCSNAEQQGSIGYSEAAAYCGDRVTILLFDSTLDKSRMILEFLAEPSVHDAVVMEGTNWFINAPRDMLEEAQPYLQGRIRE